MTRAFCGCGLPSVDSSALLVLGRFDTGQPPAGLPAIVRVSTKSIADVVSRGVSCLIERPAGGTRFEPVPIGLHFARLCYHERLYPLIFTVSALERVYCLRNEEQRS